MGDNTLDESVKELISTINSYDAISEAGLKNVMFPDDLIVAIHNHLGNINQFISSANGAFNGSEQASAYNSALTEAKALSDNLFSAQQTGLISEATFRSIDIKIRAIMESIGDLVDPEYV